MLAIPNTTTTASDQTAGAAVFPMEQGALTPFASGFLFVANESAQISIRRGSAPPGAWSPYVLVSPTMVPLSTDRAGRRTPDFIYGIKAIDAVAGVHAQVFGALYQPGEAGFIPSGQFVGSIAPGGGFTPLPNVGQELGYAQVTTPVTVSATTEGTANILVTGPTISFDGSTVAFIDVYMPQFAPNGPADPSSSVVMTLYDNGASIANAFGVIRTDAGDDVSAGMRPATRITPAAGNHTFSARAYKTGVGNWQMLAGLGGIGNYVPGFIRITQAA